MNKNVGVDRVKNLEKNIKINLPLNSMGKLVLFVCKGNSGRSQMAQAFFNKLCKPNRAISAGILLDKSIHPQTIKVMKELGIDIKNQTPKQLTQGLMESADKIIITNPSLVKYIPERYLPKIEIWEIEGLLGKSLKK